MDRHAHSDWGFGIISNSEGRHNALKGRDQSYRQERIPVVRIVISFWLTKSLINYLM